MTPALPRLPPSMDLLALPINARREALGLMEARAAIGGRARCADLAGFVREAWPVLEPDATLVWSWHLDALCEHLEAVTDGRITRLLINVPPGSSKSLIVSVLWPAWEWGPRGLSSLRYLTTSFNDGPVKRDTRKSRDLIASEWFRALWPAVTLTRAGETSFANAATGTREGVPFGSLTSQRGDRLIIDDPHSVDTAESPAERAATTRRFREGATNRLNDQIRSAIVVIMQRLHESDISGVILSLGMDYTHLCLPMEFEEATRCRTSIGFTDPRTYDGELLDAARFPRAAVEKLKRDMGSYAYAGQYQQRPAPRDGGLFKRHWFEVVDAIPALATRRVRAWDLAATERGGDATAGVRVSRAPSGIFYVEDVRHERLGPAGVEALITNTASSDGPACTIRLPQDPGAAGKAYVQSLVSKLARYAVRVVAPTGSKEVRATPMAAQAEAGNIKLLRGAWNEAFLDEMCTFPTGAHDDQVDAAADAINQLAAEPLPTRRVRVQIG